MILKHWRGRRDDVSEDDPLWDTYNQSVSNLEFGIANSKQELGYAQKKFTDTQMSAFYKGWANKYPQDSEAWRRMMMLAAQYAERAKASAGSGRRAVSDQTYVNNQARAKSKGVAYDSVTQIFTSMALTRGILNDQTEDLQDLRAYEEDSRRFLELIHEFNTSKDPKIVDYRNYLTDFIKNNGDPDFDGDFSYDSWMGMRGNKNASLESQLRLAMQAGKKGDITTLMKEQTEFTTNGLRFGLIDEVMGYEEFRGQWNNTISDPNSSVIDQMVATNMYTQQVKGLLDRAAAERGYNPEVPSSVEGHLNNEYLNLTGTQTNAPTLWDESRGQAAAAKSDPTQSDGWQTAESIKRMYQDIEKLAGGGHAMVLVDDDGNPTISGGGRMGVVPLSALTEATAFLAATSKASSVTVMTPNGPVTLPVNGTTGDARTPGQAAMLTAIVGVPVTVEAVKTDAQGQVIPGIGVKPAPNTSAEIAQEMKMPDGTTIYRYTDKNGVPRFTHVAPYAGNAKVNRLGDGRVVLTVSAAAGALTFNPKASAMNPEYVNNPDSLKDTVFLSSRASWIASIPAEQDKPLPSNTAIRTELMAETGGNMSTYGAALVELDAIKAGYLRQDTSVGYWQNLRRYGETDEMRRDSLISNTVITGPDGKSRWSSLEREAINDLDRKARLANAADDAVSLGYAPKPIDPKLLHELKLRRMGEITGALPRWTLPSGGKTAVTEFRAFVQDNTRAELDQILRYGTRYPKSAPVAPRSLPPPSGGSVSLGGPKVVSTYKAPAAVPTGPPPQPAYNPLPGATNLPPPVLPGLPPPNLAQGPYRQES